MSPSAPHPTEPVLLLTRGAVTDAPASLPEVSVYVDRRKLAKRLWRAVAADGVEIGFEGERPVRHADVVWFTASARYVVRQPVEPVLEIPLDLEPNAAALIGWAIGNLHAAVEVQSGRLLVPGDPTLRAALERLGVHYHDQVAVFQPHRFSASLAGHGHAHGLDHGHPHGHEREREHANEHGHGHGPAPEPDTARPAIPAAE